MITIIIIIIMMIITIIIIIIIMGKALVDNPSRDGVSIKILVWRYLKPNPQLL